MLWKQKRLFQVGRGNIGPEVQPDRYPQELLVWTFTWNAPKMPLCAFGVQFTQHKDKIKFWERASALDSWKHRNAAAGIPAGQKTSTQRAVLCCLNKIFDHEIPSLCWVAEDWNGCEQAPSQMNSSQTYGQGRSMSPIDTQFLPSVVRGHKYCIAWRQKYSWQGHNSLVLGQDLKWVFIAMVWFEGSF